MKTGLGLFLGLFTAVLAFEPASATVWTFDVSAPQAAGTYGSFDSGQVHYQTYNLSFANTAFTLTKGDQVIVNFNSTGPAFVVPAGTDQFLGINLEIEPNPASASTDGVMTFSTPSSGPFSTGCSNCLSNIYYSSGAAYSFGAVTSNAVYTFDQDPVQIDQISISYQVSGPVGAVPEPSTWAMLLLGFCGVGVLACRRRARISATGAT